MIVGLDEVGPRHDLPSQMQRHLGEHMPFLGIVGRGHGDEVRREHQRCRAEFLLVHHVVVHLCSEDPALVQEPASLTRAYLRALGQHVWGFGDAVQEREAAADPLVDLVEDPCRGLLVEVAGAVAAKGSDCLRFGQVGNRDDLHACGEAFEAFVNPVIVAIEDHSDQIAGGPLFGTLLD